MIVYISLLFIVQYSQCSALKLRSVQLNMYMTSSFEFCMRYLTKNSVSGCSSQRSGNRGRVINISSVDDLTSMNYSFPIVALIPPRKDIMDVAILHSSSIVGILIDGSSINATDDHFTEVSTCPENFIGSSTSSNCSIRKNKNGIDFRGTMIDKPIFLLKNKTMIDKLRDISHLYNQQQINRGKYVDAHMRLFSYAVENGEVCSRRSKSTYFGEAHFKHYSIKCRSPLISIIWSTFNPISINGIRPAKSVIIFYTKFDVFSVFQPQHAGVQSTAFGVVSLLGLAWLLGRLNLTQLLIENKDKRDIALVFLNGENWNYYGTYEFSKMIADGRFPSKIEEMSNPHSIKPIEPEHIDILINIDQLGINQEITYISYDNMHPFLQKFKYDSRISIDFFQNTTKSSTHARKEQFFREVSSTVTSFKETLSQVNSLNDFRSLNISTVAMFTNAYENMNPFYNSYQDTLIHITDYSNLEDRIYTLLNATCDYLQLPIDLNNLSEEVKQTFSDQIQGLFDCFLRSNCSNVLRQTNETGEFLFREVTDDMKENFTFLQPVLHQSDVKKYLNSHFFDASSYIHDIILNWIAVRMNNMSEIECENIENAFQHKIYQKSTDTCVLASVNSINLIRSADESIDDRFLFVSNYDEPELLIYMIDETKRDLVILLCGVMLSLCGFMLTYFLTNLLPVILNEDKKFVS